jgi:FADH2 O2-dependent halogenase
MKDYDVAIIGSGISGSTLACILAKEGLRVVMLDAGSHPRFSIGESMILETSEVMRAISHFYDIPELECYSSTGMKKKITSSHGIKKHFSFFHNFEGQVIDRDTTLQAIIPKEPYGHEIHIHRQDSDYHMVQCAQKYGAELIQNCRVDDIDFDNQGATISAGKHTIRTKFVVDSAFFGSPIRKKFNLTKHDTKTQSRALYTHMIDVDLLREGEYSRQSLSIPDDVAEGTLHHVFDGGWLWVIPFNNHEYSTNNVVSVGLMLEPDKFPFDDSVSPQEEFESIISQFPTIVHQFRNAKPIRDWVRTPRTIQFYSSEIVGDRWALLGNTAGFIDPLYSKGLYISMVSVFMLATDLIRTCQNDSFKKEQFQAYERTVRNYLEANDELVYQSYNSFSNQRHWKNVATVWLAGAYNEYVKLICNRAFSATAQDYYNELSKLRMVGGGFDEFKEFEQEVYQKMSTINNNTRESVLNTIESKTQSTPWLPNAFKDLLEGNNHLPKHKISLNVLNKNQGFMKSGKYRKAFFKDKNLADIVSFFVSEKYETIKKSW